MSEYQEIQAQIAELQHRAAAIRATERLTALENIKALMTTFQISAAEIAVDGAAPPRSRTTKSTSRVRKVPAKYRDAAGNEWSGRGLQPRWLKSAIADGVSIDSLLIQ